MAITTGIHFGETLACVDGACSGLNTFTGTYAILIVLFVVESIALVVRQFVEGFGDLHGARGGHERCHTQRIGAWAE